MNEECSNQRLTPPFSETSCTALRLCRCLPAHLRSFPPENCGGLPKRFTPLFFSSFRHALVCFFRDRSKRFTWLPQQFAQFLHGLFGLTAEAHHRAPFCSLLALPRKNHSIVTVPKNPQKNFQPDSTTSVRSGPPSTNDHALELSIGLKMRNTQGVKIFTRSWTIFFYFKK